MPAVLATSPSLRNSFGPSTLPTPSGSALPRDDLSVAEIKGKAKSVVHGVRGASAISLLRSARDQAIQGFTLEKEGDPKGALQSLLVSAQLMQLVMSHQEFKQEREGKRGLVWKEFSEFQETYGNETFAHAKGIEAKLLELEKSRVDEEPVRKMGGSIADRMKMLEDAGLPVQTTKRFSRDLSVHPTNGISKSSSPRPKEETLASPPSTQSSFPSPAMPSHPTVSSSSGHSFVPPSSLGPPSPSSSTSSPRFDNFALSEFNQTFPSIDELDEQTSTALAPPSAGMSAAFPELPSVPRTHPGDDSLPSPSVIQRFPSIPLDLDLGARPASTPIPPTTSALQSRPPSPARAHPSPVVPPKPANLSTGGAGSSNGSVSPSQRTPTNTGDSHTHTRTRTREHGSDLPVTNTVFPKTLHDYLETPDLKVLLLDIRNRDDFAKAHIKSDAVVCLEPQVLLRNGLTGEKLEDSLAVAPQRESLLFRNRDKFDLVVMYDEDSPSFGSSISPMSIAVRVIYENEFRRMLRHPPVILVGGFKAWRTTYPNEIAHADAVQEASLDPDRLKLSTSKTNGTTSPLNGSVVLNSSFHEPWSPSAQHRSSPFGMDQIPEDPSSPPELNGYTASENMRRLTRKPAISRPPSTSSISFNVRGLYDNSPPYLNGQSSVQSSNISSISYPQFPRTASSSSFGSSLPSVPHTAAIVSPPPQASINPSVLRRRGDYIDQSEQAFATRPSIDYPDLSVQHVVKPPPAAAAPSLERQDNRPRLSSHGSRPSISTLIEGPKPPMINSEYAVKYWPDMQIATKGLRNLGNTCYMNSTIQCLNATVPFARFFTDGRWKSAINMVNPLGSKGQITMAFASMLHELWHEELPYLIPTTFRKSICVYAKQFSGSEQHDSQEFLSFLLDGLHEDLNRILQKPPLEITPEREAELEALPQQIASQKEWDFYRMRNDSIVVDFFQGQFRNRMMCLTCNKTSTTYNTFMYLSLPIPAGRVSKISLQQCLDAFVKEEVMEKADAWNCPNCKTLRKATKQLSLSRLPPVLLIHLKRFTTKGHFTDKLETVVDFPLSGLDLTNYMPAPSPPGFDRKPSAPISLDDPRSQIPPYKYDIYAVTNHFGTLSSGHYTAFIKSQNGWLYCDDSRITTADSREVVGKPAYVLYYKRVKW